MYYIAVCILATVSVWGFMKGVVMNKPKDLVVGLVMIWALVTALNNVPIV